MNKLTKKQLVYLNTHIAVDYDTDYGDFLDITFNSLEKDLEQYKDRKITYIIEDTVCFKKVSKQTWMKIAEQKHNEGIKLASHEGYDFDYEVKIDDIEWAEVILDENGKY